MGGYKLRDVARITGTFPPAGYAEGSVELAAWLVHRSAQRQAASGPTQIRNGVVGRLMSRTLRSVITDLYPEWDNSGFQEVSKPVYAYLRQSGNAICLEGGRDGGSKSVWWIRDEWNEAKVVLMVLSSREPSPTERRVTADEANEDGSRNSEVEVSNLRERLGLLDKEFTCEICGKVTKGHGPATIHVNHHAYEDKVRTAILATFYAHASEALTLLDVKAKWDDEMPAPENVVLRRNLKAMVADGLLEQAGFGGRTNSELFYALPGSTAKPRPTEPGALPVRTPKAAPAPPTVGGLDIASAIRARVETATQHLAQQVELLQRENAELRAFKENVMKELGL